jgi:hypothetical protein
MDERQSQFLIALGDLFADAHLAQLVVQVRLADGDELTGVPTPPPPAHGERAVDDTGFADAVVVGDVRVPLSALVEARIFRP